MDIMYSELHTGHTYYYIIPYHKKFLMIYTGQESTSLSNQNLSLLVSPLATKDTYIITLLNNTEQMVY